MIYISKEIQNNFIDLLFSGNEHKPFGDYFIEWNFKNNFKTKTFSNFVSEWLSDTTIDKNEYYNLFDGYKSIKEFANWLVVEDEREDFVYYYLMERLKNIQENVQDISKILYQVMQKGSDQ